MPNEMTIEENVLYINALSHALRDEMRHDPSVMLMGQDIAGHGGAFKITKGFLESVNHRCEERKIQGVDRVAHLVVMRVSHE